MLPMTISYSNYIPTDLSNLFKVFSPSQWDFSFILQMFTKYLLFAINSLVVGNIALNETGYPYLNRTDVQLGGGSIILSPQNSKVKHTLYGGK